MAARLRDCLHLRELGVCCLEWINEEKAVKLHQVHGYKEYHRKSVKHIFLICIKGWVLLSFCFPERKLALAAVYEILWWIIPSLWAAERQHWAAGRAVTTWQSPLCSTGFSGCTFCQTVAVMCIFAPLERTGGLKGYKCTPRNNFDKCTTLSPLASAVDVWVTTGLGPGLEAVFLFDTFMFF